MCALHSWSGFAMPPRAPCFWIMTAHLRLSRLTEHGHFHTARYPNWFRRSCVTKRGLYLSAGVLPRNWFSSAEFILIRKFGAVTVQRGCCPTDRTRRTLHLRSNSTRYRLHYARYVRVDSIRGLRQNLAAWRFTGEDSRPRSDPASRKKSALCLRRR